jgi:predicted nucleic acid-binding protein
VIALDTSILIEALGTRGRMRQDLRRALADEAQIAAELYQAVRRPKGRELDLAIAACALSWNAALGTLNPRDFEDLPGLQLR